MFEENILEVGGISTISASASTETDTLDVERMRNYSIVFTKDSTDGNPIIEVQGSNDDVNWVNPYKFNDNITPFTMELDEVSNSVRDGKDWMYKHIRVKTIPNGTTTGTLNYVITFE